MQEQLVDWFGPTGATVIRYAIALLIVAGLLFLFYRILRSYVGKGGRSRGHAGRIAVVDTIAIDPRRRLLLVRRDNVEHLILVGGGNDLVVEPTIIRGVPVGSLGRMAQRGRAAAPGEEAETSHLAPAAAAAVAAVAVEARHETVPLSNLPHAERRRPRESTPSELARREPIVRESPVRVPEPSRPAMTVRQRSLERAPLAEHRPPMPVETTDEFADSAPPDLVEAPAAPIVEPPAAPHAESTPSHGGATTPLYDDLARKLDEALMSELTASQSAPEPIAPARPSRTSAPEIGQGEGVAPRGERTRSTMPSASAWLRPRRPAQPATPALAVEAPTPVVVPPAQTEPATAVAPSPAPETEKAPVASEEAAADLAVPTPPEPRAARRPEPPVLKSSVAPEIKVAPAAENEAEHEAVQPAPEAPAATPGSNLSSLEDEMARLLDELAGDSKGKR